MKQVLISVVSMSMLFTWVIQTQSAPFVEADSKRGQSVYASLCARCHGIDGKGDGYTKFTPPVADLTSPAVQKKMDARLFRNVHEGKPNTAMGAWKHALSEEEIRDVLSYVRRLGTAEK